MKRVYPRLRGVTLEALWYRDEGEFLLPRGATFDVQEVTMERRSSTKYMVMHVKLTGFEPTDI